MPMTNNEIACLVSAALEQVILVEDLVGGRAKEVLAEVHAKLQKVCDYIEL